MTAIFVNLDQDERQRLVINPQADTKLAESFGKYDLALHFLNWLMDW